MDDPDANPFITHRRHLDLYRSALAEGLDDDAFVALVTEADQRVAEVAGTGFRETPLVDIGAGRDHPLASMLGPVVAKVETANVAGSHKARHLFGLLLHLLIGDTPARPLAIASCGNAALGAAVVAASAGRRLQVFVPVDADPLVVEHLDALGAEVHHCPRLAGQEGDPCVQRLHEAIADGAEPFTVQGPVCPAVIDGARTLGLELADQLDGRGLVPTEVFVQIGGGALATAVMDGLARAWPDRPLPCLRPVQARAAHPYVAGWRRIAAAVLDRFAVPDPGDDRGRAAALQTLVAGVGAASGSTADGPDGGESPGAAPTQPHLPTQLHLPADLVAHGHLMTPWPDAPRSVATGILDDLTYDWVTVMAHQTATGGWPQLASEEALQQAALLASALVEPPPDATGAAGLAGLMEAATAGVLAPRSTGEVAVVVLSGVDRAWKPG